MSKIEQYNVLYGGACLTLGYGENAERNFPQFIVIFNVFVWIKKVSLSGLKRTAYRWKKEVETDQSQLVYSLETQNAAK